MSQGGDTWDVVVVGAGPAGSSTAREAARLGRRVLLLDRAHFPRGKVCGCCLNPAGLDVLRRVGLGDLASSLGAVPLTRLRLHAGSATALLSIGGVAVSRERFDAALIDAAISAGVAFRPGTMARLGPVEPDGRFVETDAGAVRAAVVVAADGLSGGLVARAGLDATPPQRGSRIGASVVVEAPGPTYEPGTIYMASGRPGYLGVVRLEDGRLDLACAIDSDAAGGGRGVGAVAESILAEVGWPVPAGLADATWKGTPRLTRRPGLLAAERLFVVGDAAGYVEPFTGEGMAWALAGAVALGPLAAAASQRWEPAYVARWTAAHRRVVRDRQGVCAWLAWALRRPWLMRAATRVLSVWPGLAAPVIHRLHAPGGTGI